MNLGKFKQYLKLNLSSKNTVINYFSQVKLFFEKMNEFNQSTVDEYIEMRVDSKISKSTLNQTIKALKQYAKFLKVDIEFPSLKKEDRRTRTYITRKELDEIIKYLPLMFSDDYSKRELVIKILFYTGLRLSELINLKRSDIDLNDRLITVRNTKGKCDRRIRFSQSLVKEIQSYFNVESERENAFNVTASYICYTVRRIDKELGFKKHIHVHSLRHAFAKHCLKIGVRESMLQQMLGHKDLETTMIYANPTEEESWEEYDKFIK